MALCAVAIGSPPPVVIGTLRRELLDRLLIVNEHHLRQVLTEYLQHYNTAWHQGIAQRTPDGKPDVPHRIGTDLDTLQIRRRPVLNDLINEYTHAA
jgi:putative transposase